eukprot:CAMPEP_0176426250 /NCGR_PEP_ID=MMETSP0127-20121128/11836_1 /TAXON_ID=938130 /ORGANISM="Platyophrya macrostoma, Strain WH" /LENGTH=48 /DNA_ID= /DNA_START= /DNA_END= /DNA_ORIENTATION=
MTWDSIVLDIGEVFCPCGEEPETEEEGASTQAALPSPSLPSPSPESMH